MGVFYKKTITAAPGIETSLILDPKEALLLPFNIGNNWTEARLCIALSGTNSSNPNLPTTSADNATATTPAELLAIGLKDSSEALPRSNGSMFWGIATSGASNLSLGGNSYITGALANQVSLNTTVVSAPSTLTNLTGSFAGSSPASAGSFCGFTNQRFIITDRGGPTQSVTVRGLGFGTTGGVGTIASDPTVANIRAQLTAPTTAPSTGTNSLASTPWHDSGVPRAIPNCIFVRFPFALSRVRIHGLVIESF